MVGSDQRRADWPISATRGDDLVVTDFTLSRNGTAWEVDTAIAQVREARSRGAELVLELSTSVVGAVVSVGGDSLKDVAPGVYWWDLQVTDGDALLTVVGGTFSVDDDVSNEEGS